MSPSAASEEYFLARRLLGGLGSANIDHRLRECDFSDDGAATGRRPFEMKIADVSSADANLLLGCNPREEVPIIGHRVRQAWRSGGRVAAINPLDWNFHFATGPDTIVPPQRMLAEAAALAAEVEKKSGVAAPGWLRPALDAADRPLRASGDRCSTFTSPDATGVGGAPRLQRGSDPRRGNHEHSGPDIRRLRTRDRRRRLAR